MIEPLTPEERAAVVELRALADGMTLAQVGARLGLSRDRVRQIEKRALVKLRRAITREETTAETRARHVDEALERARTKERTT